MYAESAIDHCVHQRDALWNLCVSLTCMLLWKPRQENEEFGACLGYQES